MKFNKMSLLVLGVLLIGTLYLGSVPTQTSATGSLSSDVEAGNTYYYTVTDFPSFNDILDLTGASDEFNATHYVDVTGTMVGSEIYLKIFDTDEQEMTYWDGSNEIDTDVPYVDFTTGLITGQELDFEVSVDGEITNTVIPAGVAIPLPIILGGATVFNVSSAGDQFLPVPFVLTDDYNLHELILTQASGQLGSGAISVTNDASQFAGELINVELGDSDLLINGLVSYDKTNGGVLQELNLELKNATNLDVLLNIDIDLDRQEYKPLNVEVGDTFELSITDSGFSHTVTSSDSELQNELDSGLTELNNNMTDLIGDVLFEFEVVEVKGLYYSVEGSISLGDETLNFPENDGFNDDVWFHGFGRLGPGVPLPTENPGRTYGYEEIYNEETEQYEYVDTDEPIPLRERAIPGPFTTADFHIFDAWDNTLTYLVGLFNAELQTALDLIEDIDSEVDFYSSTSDDVEASVAFTSDSDDSHYGGWELSADVDFGVWFNNTDEFDTVPEYSTVDVIADASLAVNYDNTVLTSIVLSGNLELDVGFYNTTHSESVNVTVSDFIVELSVDTSVEPYVPGEDDPTDDDVSTPEDGIGLDLPGFELVGAIITVFGLGIVVNLRRRV